MPTVTLALRIENFDQYRKVYDRSVYDPEGLWAEQAATFDWHRKWDQVLDWNVEEPSVKWFAGGSLNITENCLDRRRRGRPTRRYLYPTESSSRGCRDRLPA